MAAAAAYGHVWGTLYVPLGAEIGTLCAFRLARWPGAEPLRRWFGERLSVGLIEPQNSLMDWLLRQRSK